VAVTSSSPPICAARGVTAVNSGLTGLAAGCGAGLGAWARAARAGRTGSRARARRIMAKSLVGGNAPGDRFWMDDATLAMPDSGLGVWVHRGHKAAKGLGEWRTLWLAREFFLDDLRQS